MNALVPRGRPGQVIIPAGPPDLPELSRPVAVALAVALNPVIGRVEERTRAGHVIVVDPGLRMAQPPLSEAQWLEAQRAADALDAVLAPVTLASLIAWLVPVNLSCRNPQTPEDFKRRVEALAEMCGDLPAAAFNAESRRRLTANGFFPSAHDIRVAVEEEAAAWRRQRDALRRLRKAEPAPAPVVQADAKPFDRSKADEVLAELRAAGRGKDVPSERVRAARPAPVHSGYLRAIYEASLTKAEAAGDARAAELARLRLATL